MSAPQNDGEPAFPVPVGEREFWDREENGSPNGMSLRDWFAGMALMGSMASDRPGYEFTGAAEDRGQYCYKCADGMLAARKEGA